MPTTIHDILSELRENVRDNRTIGDRFERLIANYLVTDPQYADRLEDVWLWSEWPDRSGKDTGIDLVAKERATGEYWAIQCKFYLPEHRLSKQDIDSFFTASGKRFATKEGECTFSNRLIVSTTDLWSSEAEKALENQQIPVERLRVQDLDESPIDWSQFSLKNPSDIKLKAKKTLRDHQQQALDATRLGFKDQDRGKLIMACGTGKTFTSLRIAEAMVPKGGRVLFLAPSISLVAQTLREWTAEATSPFHAFAICSDSKVGREQEDLKTHDLAYPATTNSTKLAEYADIFASKDPDHRTVVFSTYQSIQVVSDAQKQGFGEFDLIICDEAHRTTGITRDGDEASDFVKVHDNAVVAGQKRLYMTATPRIFADPSKQKAKEKDAELYSMDDESKYGSVFYRIGFGEAVRRDLLTDYRVLLVAVNEDKMPSVTNAYQAELGDDKQAKAIDTRFVSKVMGTWKGLAKKDVRLVGDDGEEDASTVDRKPMKRAVAFAQSIKASTTLRDNFPALIDLYQKHTHDDHALRCDVRHVDGSQNALIRQQALEWLRSTEIDDESCRMLTNARCLSEGIDVPALDAVVFFDTRDSIVDIVQSVGRVMRKAEGKDYGYIILPVAIPSSKLKDYDSYIEKDGQFKGIWKIIKALRAHDESLVDEAEFRKKITVIGEGSEGGDGEEGGSGEQGELDLPDLPIGDISEALYAAIPKKLGDRDYWHDWAKDVARIAERIIGRIHDLIHQPETRKVFDEFLKGVKDTINPSVDENSAVEMLAQHQITRPVFEALFPDRSFVDENPVSHSMEGVIEHLDRHRVDSETAELAVFYESIRERASLAKSEKSRQDLIKGLYESFFKTAFEDLSKQLGIVYTPIEVVDFILQSADVALKTHFGQGLTDQKVHILDPFTGTGTFITRLIQHPQLIRDEDVKRKFENELHANEIVLLAYYVATVNIESAFRARGNTDFASFPGMVLTDTFQMTESDDLVDRVVLPENNARAERQNNLPIKVIVGNPPYSVTQGGAKYGDLDRKIGETYARYSLSTNKNSLYDSYIRAFRWATDRIGHDSDGNGVIAFVTNGGWIDGDATAGFRKCLQDDFSHIYVFNMRGNQRTSGELSRQEGGKVFGSGSRAPVAVTVLVRQADQKGPGKIYYYDIGDYLSREEKLAITEDFISIQNVPWETITPNESHDWINQRSDDFQKLKPLTGSDDALFAIRSNGVQTNRDAWVYNFNKNALEDNLRKTISYYNKQVDQHHEALSEIQGQGDRLSATQKQVGADPKFIKWTRGLYKNVARGKRLEFEENNIGIATYRPFQKEWVYYDRNLNEYYKESIFPTVRTENLVIQVTGTGSTKDFSALVTNRLPDLEVISKGQCLPLFWYKKIPSKFSEETDLFSGKEPKSHENGFVRNEGITDDSLREIQAHYQDSSISKEDIFYYVYGILNSSEYQKKYGADLRKEYPRVPYVEAFWEFSQAGRELAYWHLNYEDIEPFPLTEHSEKMAFNEAEHYKVKKMKWGGSSRKPDKSKIEVNDHLVLDGIPEEAHQYQVNGKSALEWVLDRYQVTKDRDSRIVNDPNEWSDDPRYIVNLIGKVTRVSVETVRIVRALPSL
jgi:predicted helicase